MSVDGEYERGYQDCRKEMQSEVDWWKKHAEAMESKVSLATRGFQVELKDMEK